MKLCRSTALRRPVSRSFIPRAAFTLVEILIAMGILSLVLAAIYSSWTSILRASKVGLDAAAAVQRARMAGRTIEECLGSALFFNQNAPYYSFLVENGDRASLSFVARLAGSFPRQGKFEGLDVRRVTFSVEQGRSGERLLVLRQAPLLMDMDKDEKAHPLVLARGVKEFRTELWDTRQQDWIDEWKDTNTLPVLAKVTLTLADSKFSQPKEQVCRIVSLPSVAVAPVWQAPRLPNAPIGGPGGPGGTPPGGLPPGGANPGGFAPGGGFAPNPAVTR